jgi:Ca2+-binding RTX toxin-like protein
MLANAANVEILTLTGSASIDATGNALDNVITGNLAANVIDGGDGDDTINGSGGNDTIAGGLGADTLAGGSANDNLSGGDGDDRLDGGIGNDTMTGGDGDDAYVVNSAAGDKVIETGGAGGGIDTIESSVNYSLAALLNVENLTLMGSAITATGHTGNNTLTGNASNNTIFGLAGDDTIVGGDGADSIIGGTGSDVFKYNSESDGGDTISDFNVGAGSVDLIDLSGIDAVAGGSDDAFNFIGGTAFSNVAGELRFDAATSALQADTNGDGIADFTITLTGVASMVAADFIDNIVGGGGNDVLTGSNLANLIDGGGGNDTLLGGDGDDTLTGGLGADVLTDGDGNDVFDYNSLADGGDMLTEFDTGVDKIDVSGIDAKTGTIGHNAFEFIETDAFTAEGQIRAVQSGANVILQFNVTGASGAEMTITLENRNTANIVDGGFII